MISPSLDENGDLVDDSVWTFTGADGTLVGEACDHWALTGVVGNSMSHDERWTHDDIAGCAETYHHLYCIQQTQGY